MHFTKVPLTIEEKIALLKERGLLIPDEERASKYLNHIGYFRLTGYFKYYQNPETNQFYEWITFDQVLDLYIFDRKLRLLVLDAIEKIEVSIKAQIDDVMSSKYGCFWYTDTTIFSLKDTSTAEIYKKLLDKILTTKEKSSAVFIQAYTEKYDEELYLPSRMMLESGTFGEISVLLNFINKEDMKLISQTYTTFYVDLRRRIHLLVNVRNIVAHHERLRNRKFNATPRINDVIFRDKYAVQEKDWKQVVASNLFNVVLIIQYLLRQISSQNDWLERLEHLFKEYPTIPMESMGFDKYWREKIP